MNRSYNSLEATAKGYQAEIDAANAKAAANNQAKRDELAKRLASARSALEAAQASLASAQQAKVAQDVRVNDLSKQRSDLEGKAAGLQRQITEADGMLAQAKASERDVYVPYGQNIGAVLRDIENARWEGEKPVGPLGLYVKAKDPERWGEVLRITLRQTLLAFAVGNVRDRKMLQAILKKHNW